MNSSILKICRKCNVPNTLDNFHYEKTGKYQKKAICKTCRRLVNKQLYKNRVERNKQSIQRFKSLI